MTRAIGDAGYMKAYQGKNGSITLWLSLVLGAALLSGCFSKKPPEPPKPAKLELAVVAATDLNPDATGRASPLVVRIYALRSLTEFEKADFFALYEKDEQILAADLAKREEFVLKPGETITQPREYTPDVQFIAVMGAYRDVERSTWRASTKIAEGANGVLSLRADQKALSVSIEDEAAKD